MNHGGRSEPSVTAQLTYRLRKEEGMAERCTVKKKEKKCTEKILL